MKKRLILLLSLILLSTACNSTVSEDDNTSVEKTPVERTNTVEDTTLSTYTDDVLGISFTYPSEWGNIEINEEEGYFGTFSSYEEFEEYKQTHGKDGVIYRTLEASDLENGEFLSASNGGAPEARGGWWADIAMRIDSENALTEYCSNESYDICEVKENPNGIKYAYSYQEDLIYYETNINNIYEFVIYHEGNDFRGIAISNQSLSWNDSPVYAEELQALVDSLEFVD